MSLNAKQLDEQYRGVLTQPPLSDCTSAYHLHKACQARQPKIDVSHETCKQWWKKYRVATTPSVSTAKELDDKYGERVRQLAPDNRSAYLLCKALRQCDPPIFVSDGIAKQWLHTYFGPLQKIESADQLEKLYGPRIRENSWNSDRLLRTQTGTDISEFLLEKYKVSVSSRTCQHWLSIDWSSAGGLRMPEQVEQVLGDRLRLNEYRHQFSDASAADVLSDVLAENDPPVNVSGQMLRQWYTKYHPDSGPLKYQTSS